jgi:hypothetical protein
MNKKALVFGIMLLFFGATVILSNNVKGSELNNMGEWFENFDDGDISDWTIQNPYGAGNHPITLGLSTAQSHSPSYSMIISSPYADWYSGAAWGPTIPVNLSKSYTVEFWFRWTDFHWHKLIIFGCVHIIIDLPYLPVYVHDDSGDHHYGPDFESYCPVNTWTHFQFNVNPNTSSYEMIVNGNPIFTYTYSITTPYARQFHFYDNGGEVPFQPDYCYNCYYDDIHVTYIDEKLLRSFIFGRITNLSNQDDYIQFEAVKTRVIIFSPFSFNTYTSGEKFTISNNYMGIINLRFIFAFCKINI